MHRWLENLLAFFGVQKPVFYGEFRTVFVNHKRIGLSDALLEGQLYPDNRVVTSRYTVYNFLIKNMLEQFTRVANFYFLIAATTQLLIDAPVSPTSSFVPLAFVLGATAVKQAYEDILRHKSDDTVNLAPVKVVRENRLVDIKSLEIQVGDVVRIHQNESFPCDLILLSSSEDTGECRITTANLDGESNLKTVHSVELTRHLRTAADIGANLRAQIDCEQPTADLYKFKGNISVRLSTGLPYQVSLSIKNLLLRGAVLRNTKHVMGVAVYTGQETKMQLNSQYGRSKKSVIERRLDKFLVCLLGVLLFMVIVCSAMKWSYANHKTTVTGAWYLPVEQLTPYRIIQDFMGYLILFNYMIPIALYVTMEVTKFVSSKFIEYDLSMYYEDPETGEKMPARANTSDLNEELGQVQYLFSDKTGTLTENKMTFRHCSVDGRTFSEFSGELWETDSCGGQRLSRCERLGDRQLLFFTVLALCHTIRVERPTAYGNDEQNRYAFSTLEAEDYTYQASSPDEKAFVEAARSFGIIFHGTEGGVSTVSLSSANGECIVQQFRLLHVLEFDSERKCMSVIVQRADGAYWLLTKGAESTMLEKCCTGDKDSIVKFSAEFAVQGLRVLAIGHKELTEAEYEQIKLQFSIAEIDVANRDAKLTEVYMSIEQGLEALGLTAIEDELQPGVCETLTDLREAGIQVWVLTGDKRETAENISLSSGHFVESMQRIRIVEQLSADVCRESVSSGHEMIEASKVSIPINFCTIVDGDSLQFILSDEHPDLRDSFLELCCKTAAVLCCRCTPLQKARIIAMVKHGVRPEPTTCAIGDGANDVSMIREAHVGIGIFGKEGRAAALNADYAFARFAFTRTALLFHGHLFYIRLSNLVLYCFYKSIVFVMPPFFFAFFSAFSAQPMYDTAFFILYNMTMTSLPIFLYGLFEQHLPRQRLESEPRLYRGIANNRRLSWGQLALWCALGLWHSACCFFGVAAVFLTNDWVGSNGYAYDVYAFGTVVITCVLVCVTTRILLITYSFSVPTLIGFLFSTVTYVILLSAYSGISTAFLSKQLTYYWTYFDLSGQPSSWLLLLCVSVLAVAPDLAIRFLQDWRTELELKIAKNVCSKCLAGELFAMMS
ncbi:hypothetical protein BOX15_Mlig016307g2 [Macrostomum lignano]|uniref:Phospholipid-transporting ATPase n=1 Tax=Macrostomum lignano TaxID=282301 RepID=A0A267DPM7_9PLAT|nr:hypothetical protein BOX15_Mlig016307g2 [Macrostomum lignano]